MKGVYDEARHLLYELGMSGIVMEEKYHIGHEEFEQRAAALTEKARELNLNGIVILGSSAAPENLTYVSNYCLIGADMAPYAGGFGSCGWYGAFVVSTNGDAPTLILDRNYWIDIARKVSWIEDIRSGNDIWEVVGQVMQEKNITGKYGLVADGFAVNHYRTFEQHVPKKARAVVFDEYIRDLRMIKSPAEIKIMQHSIDIQTDSYLACIDMIQDGVEEWQIAEAIRYQLRKRGATSAPSLCVLSGPNSEVSLAAPQAKHRVIRNGDMMLVTVFSYYQNYTTGIDRPFVCGPASDKQKRLADIELNGLRKALNMLEPGLRIKDMYKPVYYDYIVPELDRQGFTNYKIQGIMGHATGLSLSEIPILSPKDDTVLKPGMVLHVEPGIYLTGQSMGLRTAEMVLITQDGYEVLTKEMPVRSGSLA